MEIKQLESQIESLKLELEASAATIKVLKELEKRKKLMAEKEIEGLRSKWVSCDTLPTKQEKYYWSEDVMVIAEDNISEERQVFTASYNFYSYEWEHDYIDDFNDFKIIKWKPMPKEV